MLIHVRPEPGAESLGISAAGFFSPDVLPVTQATAAIHAWIYHFKGELNPENNMA